MDSMGLKIIQVINHKMKVVTFLNHKQMVLLEALFRRIWFKRPFQFVFQFENDRCSGNFIEEKHSAQLNNSADMNAFIEIERLEKDYQQYFNKNKAKYEYLKDYKEEEDGLKQVIVWMSLLNISTSFLGDREDNLNDYLLDSEIPEVIYNYQ